MGAETARDFEALESQARILMGAFSGAGFQPVAPAIIQPAAVYLDVIGEALRSRTYVFTDPEGEELCLRPDLTVPTCRLHLEREANGTGLGHYCYNGAAFRFQPTGATAAHPREFRQAGIESIGETDREKAEAETLALIVDALKQAGMRDYKLRFGDLGLFRSVLSSADMPKRWRHRLMHHFWRPDAFRAELMRLCKSPADKTSVVPSALISDLEDAEPEEAVGVVAKYLDDNGIEVVGARTVSEISENLQTIIADATAEPLSEKTASLLEGYIGVAAPARAAGARLKDLSRDQGIDISEALDAYQRRLQLLSDVGVNATSADFSAEFGRTLEYYSGFVFEISVPELGVQSPVAGGGRYDGLLRMCGASEDTPALGAAIHTERLLSVVRNGSAQS